MVKFGDDRSYYSYANALQSEYKKKWSAKVGSFPKSLQKNLPQYYATVRITKGEVCGAESCFISIENKVDLPAKLYESANTWLRILFAMWKTSGLLFRQRDKHSFKA